MEGMKPIILKAGLPAKVLQKIQHWGRQDDVGYVKFPLEPYGLTFDDEAKLYVIEKDGKIFFIFEIKKSMEE